MLERKLEVAKVIETEKGYALERHLRNDIDIIERPGAFSFYIAEVNGVESRGYVEVELVGKCREKILEQMYLRHLEPDEYRFLFDHRGHVLVMGKTDGLTETELYYHYI